MASFGSFCPRNRDNGRVFHLPAKLHEPGVQRARDAFQVSRIPFAIARRLCLSKAAPHTISQGDRTPKAMTVSVCIRIPKASRAVRMAEAKASPWLPRQSAPQEPCICLRATFSSEWPRKTAAVTFLVT